MKTTESTGIRMSAERPVIFSGPLVRAILDGRKTVTRRLVTPATSTVGGVGWGQKAWDERLLWDCGEGPWVDPGFDDNCAYLKVRSLMVDGFDAEQVVRVRCRIEPADVLYVRETWATVGGEVVYRATFANGADPDDARNVLDEGRWRPSIHMPRWASRIDRRIVSVRPERLQAITPAEIVREGIEPEGESVTELRQQWIDLWDSINGKRAPWADNPWVWRIEFERCR